MSLTKAGIRWYAVKEGLYSIWSSTFSVNIPKNPLGDAHKVE